LQFELSSPFSTESKVVVVLIVELIVELVVDLVVLY